MKTLEEEQADFQSGGPGCLKLIAIMVLIVIGFVVGCFLLFYRHHLYK